MLEIWCTYVQGHDEDFEKGGGGVWSKALLGMSKTDKATAGSGPQPPVGFGAGINSLRGALAALSRPQPMIHSVFTYNISFNRVYI